MNTNEVETNIRQRGQELFADIRGETPSIFAKNWWAGKVLDWCMSDEKFKIQLFRFIDVFPYLTNLQSVTNHIVEYFGGKDHQLPSVLKWGTKSEQFGGKLTAKIVAGTIHTGIEKMARNFIVGANIEDALGPLTRLRKGSCAFSVDLLGEAVVSEDEADQYQKNYLALLGVLKKKGEKWSSLGSVDSVLDWGHTPKINISIKPTAFYSQTDPANFEGSVQAILSRLKPVLTKLIDFGAFAYLDMEQFKYKDIILEVYRRIRSDPNRQEYPHIGIALQSYLRHTDADLENLLNWSAQTMLPISIRLVKGAYWDYETIIAEQNGWDAPVYSNKAKSDAAFERQARKILENHDRCYLACGSHNIRTISAVLEMARALNVPKERYEFQLLYGMAEPIQKALLKLGEKVRIYCPCGDLISGMSYFVRRLLENTANESFLRLSFVDGIDIDNLLKDPLEVIKAQGNKSQTRFDNEAPQRNSHNGSTPFRNEPVVDFTRPDIRSAFPKAIMIARKMFGNIYPLIIEDQEIRTTETLPSLNPADPSEVVGLICQANRKEVDLAIRASENAYPSWRKTSPVERAQVLFRAAGIVRTRLFELAALEVLEVGKQWGEAYSDVTEAVDFLEYYGREMIRLGNKRRLNGIPGEVNLYSYRPKGIAAVIAPWNFPFAISCGMCSAAIVTGNCVLYKPSSLSTVVGFALATIFRDAGLPKGVFNYIPGPGREMGDYLVEHPKVSVIAFTGSVEVGTCILERAGKIRLGQSNIKKVIAEMGGKNAIIVDDDADLDEVIVHVVKSAFGFQGQKCSACSRVIVVEPIYERFLHRLMNAANSIRIGPAEDPANSMGPVVDNAAKLRLLEYIEIGKQEGTLVVSREVPQKGFYVPLTIFTDIKTDHRIAQEEIFGPVLAVMIAKSFTEAIDFANSTRFALTGGVFSRSPRHLQQACESLRVGNLYLNRGITGAMVERQPFGGFKMSGIGSKAGGPDYLLQFMDPQSITENTLRKGFAPIKEGVV